MAEALIPQPDSQAVSQAAFQSGPQPAAQPLTCELAAEEPARQRALYRGLVTACLLIGAILRLRHYASGRSLWLDEAMLGLNILNRSFGELLRPLADDQGAPLGFLWAAKASTLALGASEYALRSVPLLLGLACLPLFYLLCRRVLGREGGLIGLLLAAIMPALIYYSAEVKQYIADVGFALAILLLAAEQLDRGPRRSGLLLLATIGAVGVWCSHAAVFVAGGAGLVLMVHALRRWPRRAWLWPALMGTFWAINVAAVYLVSLRALSANRHLREYWTEAFLPFPPTGFSAFARYASSLLGLSEMAFTNYAAVHPETGNRVALLGVVIAVAGGIWLFRHGQRGLLALLLSPVALAAVAAMARRYPFEGRLMLFAVVPLVVLMAAGILAIGQAAGRRWQILLLTGLLALPAAESLEGLWKKPGQSDLRPVLAEVAQRRQPGDVVYVYYAVRPVAEYYRQYGPPGIRGLPMVYGRPYQDGREFREELARLASAASEAGREARVWVIFSHVQRIKRGEEQAMLNAAAGQVSVVEQLEATKARAYLLTVGEP